MWRRGHLGERKALPSTALGREAEVQTQQLKASDPDIKFPTQAGFRVWNVIHVSGRKPGYPFEL